MRKLTSNIRRRVILGCSVAAFAVGATSAFAQKLEGRLTVQSQGGTTEKVYMESVYKDFTKKTGVSVGSVSIVSEEALARMIGEASNPSIDLFQFTGGQELEAKVRGLAQPVGDLSSIRIPPNFIDKDGMWVGVGAVPSGILYNKKFIKEPPTSMQDFLKPEYAGKVGLASFTNAKGLDFLVMLSKSLGGSEDDTDKGMKAIEGLLKNNAKVYSVASQLKTMFAQEEIWIAYYDVANALNAIDQGMPIGFVAPKEGMSTQVFTNVIAKNSKNGDAARAAIAAALTTESQLALAEKLGWFPVNQDVKLPATLTEKLGLKELRPDSMVVLDRAKMNERKADWLQQFNTMAAR